MLMEKQLIIFGLYSLKTDQMGVGFYKVDLGIFTVLLASSVSNVLKLKALCFLKVCRCHL